MPRGKCYQGCWQRCPFPEACANGVTEPRLLAMIGSNIDFSLSSAPQPRPSRLGLLLCLTVDVSVDGIVVTWLTVPVGMDVGQSSIYRRVRAAFTRRWIETGNVPGREGEPTARGVPGGGRRRNVQFSVRQHAPQESMSRLVEALRDEMEPFIDPGRGRIGHAFPIEGGSAEQIIGEDDGLFSCQYHSELLDFARALVQAAAVMGVGPVTSAMVAWCQGQSVEVRMATVLSGVLLSETVAPRGDIELVPLALSTAELPRLPMFRGDSAVDYLGLTLARLTARTHPAIFRPYTDGKWRNGSVPVGPRSQSRART